MLSAPTMLAFTATSPSTIAFQQSVADAGHLDPRVSTPRVSPIAMVAASSTAFSVIIPVNPCAVAEISSQNFHNKSSSFSGGEVLDSIIK